MANLPVPTEGFSAGSIGSSSFLGMAQTIQVTWKTSYNSALRKVYDFLYSCRNPLSSLLPNTHSTGYLNLSSMLAQFQPCLSLTRSQEAHAIGSVTSWGKDPLR